MHTSEHIGDLAAALAKAQGEFTAIAKNKVGKVKGQTKAGKDYEYEYKYAALPDVLDGIKSALASNGLAISQATVIAGSVMILRSRIIHTSGQFLESEYPVCSISGEHQKMGAAMTYARRYALTSLVGVAADEDADGQGVEAAHPTEAPRQRSHEHDTTRLPPRPTATSKAQQDKAAYVEKALAEIADIDSTDRLTVWWNAEAKNRQLHFDANDDPLYHQIKAAAKKRGDVLAETAQEAAE